MTSDGMAILSLVFTTIWSFFNSWYIPGTSVTPAMFFIFLAFAGIVWRFIRSFNGDIRVPEGLPHVSRQVLYPFSQKQLSAGSPNSLVRR